MAAVLRGASSIHYRRAWMKGWQAGQHRSMLHTSQVTLSERRSSLGAHVPFVDDLGVNQSDPSNVSQVPLESIPGVGPLRDEAQQQLGTSTITNSERYAFAKLFDNFSAPTMGAAKAKSHASQRNPIGVDVESYPSPLQSMAAKAQDKVRSKAQADDIKRQVGGPTEAVKGSSLNLAEDSMPPNEAIQSLRDQQHQRVEDLLSSAPTDHELWRVLEKEAFEIVRNLQLDEKYQQRSGQGAQDAKVGKKAEKQVPKKGKKKSKLATGVATQGDQDAKDSAVEATIQSSSTLATMDSDTQLAVMGANFPSFVLIGARQLRQGFPGSELIFNILPTIRQLGRSSYILAASTPLYNELIEANWHMYNDFERINGLLNEMENAALDFDESTYAIIAKIRRDGYEYIRGDHGLALKHLWSADIVHDSWRKVIAWQPMIRERLQTAES